ncbi:hypothetical protein BDV41DRAFT_516803 [Aspergillus transmontanensis]|uniref:Uncharacterized protein n=1 Tax=Aspergillus transmontanensis TaxID=1034304 RepID=A0A5N6WGZ9_9EURO|nr:hypothetical protein BDV41DRAFT_516803 [Aspergillus transmontanensis]
MPNNWEDWQETHMIYYRVLIENGLYCLVLLDSYIVKLEDRAGILMRPLIPDVSGLSYEQLVGGGQEERLVS